MEKEFQSGKHGSNLRIGRRSIAGQIYLLTTVTENRRDLFVEFNAACSVAQVLMFCHLNKRCQSLAWVLMPDHLHWLVALGENESLSGLMHTAKGYSALRLNQYHGCAGRRVWQTGYHDHAVRQEEDLRRMARYVIANPLRANLVQRIGDYPFWDAIWL